MILRNAKVVTSHSNLQSISNLVYKKSFTKEFSNFTKTTMFTNQLNLPPLPVPTLKQTIEKYIKSVTPFLNENELNTTKKLLQEFCSPNGTGEHLQKLLISRAKSSENWLSEWWLNTAYLEYRDPVVIFSSPGLVFPSRNFRTDEEMLLYTAKLILAAVDFKLKIDSNQLPVDMMGKDSLDMNQYKKIFGTCRIPREKRDEIKFNPDSRHIVIVKNNNFFSLEILNKDMKVMSLKQLLEQLKTVLNESNSPGYPVGILTTENRDNWSLAYKELIKDPLNQKSVLTIETSLFLIAFDRPVTETKDSLRTLASKQCIHGGGSRANSSNRWFDKTVQFIIGQNGVVGLTYEHSPSEGQPIASMTDYLMNYIEKNSHDVISDTKTSGSLQKLTFNINNKIKKFVAQASENIDELVDDLDMDSFQFNYFGKEFVKSQKLSPDSFIQIAMQYAFYRIHKTPGAHYESAATRKYIHGRTETIRSCSIESIAFAKTMLDSTKTISDKVSALKEAIKSHKQYSIEAVNGFGVDRHLLGLKLTAIEQGMELPELFRDPAFTRSSRMRLSTSQVATKCDGFMCYGPLTGDGYGCCYNPRPHDINFGVSAFLGHPDTSARVFREALEESLRDMHDLLAKGQKAKL